ncbi:Cys-Gln thioester bond-forming surface protein [Streptomyces longwoodensis]|uniref:Cys-Gln thioester bond-forming surface protein n=1 Tax=Streptomyces longwoodensis TaxID=68231 RepID=UPI003804F831
MLSWFSAPFARGRGAGRRLAAAAVVSGLVAAGALTAAGPAAADATARSQSGATAAMDGLKTYGTAVVHGAEGDQEVSAGLFEMSVDGGGTLQTYCVDLHNPTQKDAQYHETPWSGTSLAANKNAGRVLWIVQHSYPQVNDLAALAKKAGVTGGLTEQDAAAGTQVAIWRYSDGADVDAVDPQAERLADYLQKAARTVPEPAASLALDTSAVSGHRSERLGPITVRTRESAVTVVPPVDAATTGVRVVDEAGKPVTTAANGSRLFFDVPADAPDGTAELTLQTSTTVPVGRAFTADSRSQTQILAGSSESTVSATATATWAARGAIPALSAAKDCTHHGLAVTAANQGDEDFTYSLMGTEYTVAAGQSRTVTIPLQEDQAYDFTIGTQRFAGILDCLTRSTETATADLTTQTLAEPSPATIGGTATDTNLAETGGTSATPLIAGTAIALVVIGGAVLVLLGRKENTAGE